MKLTRDLAEGFSDLEQAALYDQLHPPGERNDFRFYLPMIMAVEAVLDVGCGTGALLHMAREAGHAGRLVGLDPAVGMLEQAMKRSDIEWILGEHGTDFTDADGNDFHWEAEVDLPVIGDLVTFRATITSPRRGQPQNSSSTLRFLDSPRLEALLAEAGLAVDQQFGYWDRSPLTDASPEIITTARRSTATAQGQRRTESSRRCRRPAPTSAIYPTPTRAGGSRS